MWLISYPDLPRPRVTEWDLGTRLECGRQWYLPSNFEFIEVRICAWRASHNKEIKFYDYSQGFRWHLEQYRMKRFSGRERWVSEVLACRSVRGHVTQGIFKIALSKCNFLRSLEKKWLTGKVFFNGIMKCLMANQWKIEMIFTLKK